MRRVRAEAKARNFRGVLTNYINLVSLYSYIFRYKRGFGGKVGLHHLAFASDIDVSGRIQCTAFRLDVS